MKFVDHKEFYRMVNGYSGRLIADIISAYNISFFTLHLNIDREDIDEICREECIDLGLDPEKVTVIYNIVSDVVNDREIKCGVLNVELPELIILFNKTKKLKAFL